MNKFRLRRIVFLLLAIAVVDWTITARSDDLSTISGAANEPPIENHPVQLAAILPQYEVPKNIEDGVMVGSETLEELLKQGAGIHPVVKGANFAANVISAFHEASEIGLEEGHARIGAELYLLRSASNELHDLIAEAKSQGKPPDAAKLAELRLRFQRMQTDFKDHGTPGEFFKRAVYDEASPETLANELAVFGKEFGLKPLFEHLLGRLGGKIYDFLGLGKGRRWLWKELRPELRNLLGKNVWKEFSKESRLALYRKALSEGGKKIGAEMLAQIDLKISPMSFDERLQIVERQIEATPPHLPPPQIVTTNSLQAIAVVQNLALQPASLAPQSAERPALAPAALAPLRVQVTAPPPMSYPAASTSETGSTAPVSSERSGYSKSEWNVVTSRSTIQLSNSQAYEQARQIDLGIRGFDSGRKF